MKEDGFARAASHDDAGYFHTTSPRLHTVLEDSGPKDKARARDVTKPFDARLPVRMTVTDLSCLVEFDGKQR
ncbi:hypothetical protein IDVR_27260 [Intrasporangium sp. DVR]